MTTPSWLLQRDESIGPCSCAGRRSRGSFVDRTIRGGSRVLHQALFADDTAHRAGLLQRLDARTKLVGLLGLVVTGSLVHHLAVLGALYAVALALAAASALSLRFFVARVWLFIPVFTGVVALPATTSLVTRGDIVVPLGTWFGTPVGLTAQGLLGATTLVARVSVSISFVVLLTLTTPWNAVLAALRSLRVPRMFVVVLAMAYRYIFVLLGAVQEMYTARKAREIRRDDHRSGRAFVAASAGALFGRSHAMADEIHMAMVARGFRGEVRTLSAPRLRRIDLQMAIAAAALAALTLGVDHAIR